MLRTVLVSAAGLILSAILAAMGTLFVLVLQVIVGAASAFTDGALANGLHVALGTLVWSGVITTALLTVPRADRQPVPAQLRTERTAV